MRKVRWTDRRTERNGKKGEAHTEKERERHTHTHKDIGRGRERESEIRRGFGINLI